MKTIQIVTRILQESLLDVWNDLWTTLVVNLLWTLSVCLIIPGPPATLALVSFGSRLAHGEVTDLGDYWQAFRRYWGLGWRWGALNLLVIGLLAGDAILTNQVSSAGMAPFAQGFYLAALAGWLVLQFVALPFLFEQKQLSLRQALRNAVLLVGQNLGFTAALVGLLVLLLAAGTLFFMLSFAFGGVIVAITGSQAVQNRLESQKSLSEGKPYA